MDVGDVVLIVIALLVAVGVGVPQMKERRGELWKSLAEEREVAVNDLRHKLAESQARVHELELRPDMTALHANVAQATELAIQRYEEIQRAIQAHEQHAQERGERIVSALDRIAAKLDGDSPAGGLR